MSNKSLLAWHFLSEDRRTAHDEEIAVVAGQTLKMRPPVQLCSRGYHASVRAIDALQFAPGPIVCRVKLHGTVVLDTDKAVATRRTCLWIADATRTLHEFALWCAEQALEQQKAIGFNPHEDSWKALQVKRLWLDDEATDDELSAARSAARSAAWSAAWSAARSAARSAQNEQLERMLFKLEPTILEPELS